AHHVTGRIVAKAANDGVVLHELPLKEMQAIEPKISKDVLGVLSVESSVKSRTSFGGTAPKNVAAQAKAWAKRLEKERKLGREKNFAVISARSASRQSKAMFVWCGPH